MSDDRLTPEEAELLKIAREYGAPDATPLGRAIAEYRKSIDPPEPFRALMSKRGSAWKRLLGASGDMFAHDADEGDEVWRCTVTPTERIR